MSEQHDRLAEQAQAIPALAAAAAYAALEARPEGLQPEEAAARLARYGRNAIQEVRGKPLWLKLLANFTHLMALLLWVGGVVGFVAGMPQLGVAIWMVNVINGVFSFWQEFRAEKATAALRKLLPHFVRVLRNGEEQRISAEELVPGDVMLLAEGDRISADGRLVEEAELRADQSTLTGESHPVRKTSEAVLRRDLAHAELPNLVFAGTNVVAGTGKAVVLATGMETEFGKIAHLTQSVEEELSPAAKRDGLCHQGSDRHGQRYRVLFFLLAVIIAGISLYEGFIFAMGWSWPLYQKGCSAGYPIAGHGHTANGQAPRPGQAALRGRDLGLHLRHLHRQDRDADAERDDRTRDMAGRPAAVGDRRRLRP